MAATNSSVSSQFPLSEPPNPAWSFGKKTNTTPAGREWMQGVDSAGWKTIDVATEDSRKLSSILTSGIVPRPVAFVSSISEDGIENLAPFSWFNQVSALPPVISVSVTRDPALAGRVKDTARNIKTTREFVVNIISEPWVTQANVCSVDAPPEINEWAFSGLTREPSVYVKAPRVKESAFSMECELLEFVDIKDPKTSTVTTTLFLASVKYIHMRNDMLDERGNMDPGKFKPVGKMVGSLWTKVNEGYSMERPVWGKHGEELVRSASEDSSPSK